MRRFYQVLCLFFIFIHHSHGEPVNTISFNVFEDGHRTYGKLKINDLYIDTDFYWTKENFTKYTIGLNSKEPWSFDLNGNFNVQPQENGQVSLKGHLQRKDESFKAEIESNLKILDEMYDIGAKVMFSCGSNVTGLYMLNLRLSDSCPKLYLNHNITTSPEEVLDFKSSVEESCEFKDDGRIDSKMGINITLKSQVWEYLSTDLEQIFVFNGDADGYEAMKASNPYWDMSVSADWTGSPKKRHEKIFRFAGKRSSIPSFNLHYLNEADDIKLSFSRSEKNSSPPSNQCPTGASNFV